MLFLSLSLAILYNKMKTIPVDLIGVHFSCIDSRVEVMKRKLEHNNNRFDITMSYYTSDDDFYIQLEGHTHFKCMLKLGA